MPFSLPLLRMVMTTLSVLEHRMCELRYFTEAAHNTTAETLQLMLGLLGPTPALYAIMDAMIV